MTKRFDPFNDRIARDIRNSLSSAFIKSVELFDIEPVQKTGSNLLKLHPESVYSSYIENRLLLYKQVIEKTREERISSPLNQAIEFWDRELFFEFHELLEKEWMSAVGEEKIILQALIRAAGVYVHLEQGNLKGAKKMSAKSLSALSEYRERIPKILNLELLFEKLRSVDPVPPKLSLLD